MDTIDISPTRSRKRDKRGGFSRLVKKLVPGMKKEGRGTKQEEVIGQRQATRQNLTLHQREIERLRQETRTQFNHIVELKKEQQRLIDSHNEELCVLDMKARSSTIEVPAGVYPISQPKDSSPAEDLASVDSVKSRVTSLNDEISRAAASLAGSMIRQPHGLTEQYASVLYNEVVELVGEPIAHMLIDNTKNPLNRIADSLLIQGALQVFMTSFCVSKIGLWVPHDEKISSFLTTVYTKIQRSEAPSAAGRWRALTRKHITISKSAWKRDIMSGVMKIIQIGPWTAPEKDQRAFEDKLAPILRAVEDLRMAIGEMIISTDIQLTLVLPETPFGTGGMDDAFADGGVSPVRQNGVANQRVLGTTGMGLKRVVNGTLGTLGEIVYATILRPSVMLEATVRAHHHSATLNSVPVDAFVYDAIRRGVVEKITSR